MEHGTQTKVALAATAAALALGVASARAASPAASEVSPSWAGYVATAPEGFTHVSGGWTVPAVRCRGARTATSAAWVGLGGFASKEPKVQQVGTDSNCDAAGHPKYFAWFEVVPYPAYTIASKVEPGDEMAGAVTLLPGNVELRLADRTRGWTFARRISWASPDKSSAEWVIEAPALCVRYVCARPSLADFGAVTFRDAAAAVAGGHAGPLAGGAWALTGLTLVPHAQSGTMGVEDQVGQQPATTPDRPPISPAGASPGAVAPGGSAFTIAWAADERRAPRR
jgi:Peptidase A4 family